MTTRSPFVRQRFVVRVSTILLLAALTAPLTAHAGTGVFKDGKFHFCVSLRWNATPEELALVEKVFKQASEALADATDGQHRFGAVRIVDGEGASQSAEYFIHKSPGRAYAPLSKYGVRSEHVNLFFESNFGKNGLGDALTIVHQHVHHAYGALDEYIGPHGEAECAPAPEKSTLDYCLMDNYLTRGGRAQGSGKYTLKELCTRANHDPDGDTWQQYVHGMSVWETIADQKRFPLVAPAGTPDPVPPPREPVDFQRVCKGSKIMLLLDKSGSMGSERRMEFARSGATAFTTFSQDEDQVGVASFEDMGRVDYPLTSLAEDGAREALRKAIEGLWPGSSTNIGDGLKKALSELTGQECRSCDETIILLSDGDHNTGTNPADVLPLLKDERVSVTTVGVGTGISPGGEELLQQIASETGGKYHRLADSYGLVGHFIRLAMKGADTGMLIRKQEEMAPNELRVYQALVEPSAAYAIFVVTFADDANRIRLELESPSGEVIEESSQSPTVKFIKEANSKAFKVKSPLDGKWKIKVSTGNVTSGETEIMAFAHHPGMQLNASVENPTVSFPESVLIHATPQCIGQNVLRAQVSGAITAPDGTSIPIVLYDSGLIENGDSIPFDGVYSARFSDYKKIGTYDIELAMETAPGSETYEGEKLYASEPISSKRVPVVSRRATATFIVRSIPPDHPATATLDFRPEEIIYLNSLRKCFNAYIELPEGMNPKGIKKGSVAITAIDGNGVRRTLPVKPASIGDFNENGVPDSLFQFERKALKSVARPGMRTIRIEGEADGKEFVAERRIELR